MKILSVAVTAPAPRRGDDCACEMCALASAAVCSLMAHGISWVLALRKAEDGETPPGGPAPVEAEPGPASLPMSLIGYETST